MPPKVPAAARKKGEITKYFERISQQYRPREQDAQPVEDPRRGPSDEEPPAQRRRTGDMLGGFGRSGEEESSASVGGKPLGRPPVAASGLQAGRPQLGRNSKASTKPNKPGRPRRGALSEAEKRRRSLQAGERAAQAELTEFVRPDLGAPVPGVAGVVRSKLKDFLASARNLLAGRSAGVGKEDVLNLLARVGRYHAEDVEALEREIVCLGALAAPGDPDATPSPQPMPTPNRPDTSQTALISRSEYSLGLQRFGVMQLNDDGAISENLRALVTLPPNFVYDKLLEAATHISVDGAGCWLQDIKRQQGYLGSHQRYHLRLKHPITGALVRVNAYRHQLAAIAGGWAPCMLRTYRTVPLADPEADELDLAEVHVSHLCHAAECFNPRHMVIEYPADNWARNLCGSAVVVYIRWANGTTTKVDPCEHGSVLPNRLQCILPTVRLDAQTPTLRTGYMNAPLFRLQRPKPCASGPAYGGYPAPDRRYLLSSQQSDECARWCEHVLRGGNAANFEVQLPYVPLQVRHR